MYQQAPYVLQTLPPLREAMLALLAQPVSDQEQMYKRSYEVQPKIDSSSSSTNLSSKAGRQSPLPKEITGRPSRTGSAAPIPVSASMPHLGSSPSSLSGLSAGSSGGGSGIVRDTSAPSSISTAPANTGPLVASKGARLLLLVEGLRQAARELLESKFPGCAVQHWSARAPAGVVYSWDEDVLIEYVEQPHGFVVVHTCLQATRAELAYLQRAATFFQLTRPVSPLLSLRLLCITMGTLSDERRVATDLDMDLVLCAPKERRDTIAPVASSSRDKDSDSSSST